MKPTIGRIVTYKLSQEDVDKINRRRTDGRSIADRISEGNWPIGAQAHIGNIVAQGDELPMIITWAISDTMVSGQVFLDGTDTFWATSVEQGDLEGDWNWPERK